jgi:hypothetical protein
MKFRLSVFLLAVAFSSSAIASPDGEARQAIDGPVLHLDVVDPGGAEVGSFHVNVLSSRGKIIEEDFHDVRSGVTMNLRAGAAIVNVAAPHFRPVTAHVNIPAALRISVQRSPTIHVLVRDAITAKTIGSSVGTIELSECENTPLGLDLTSVPNRQFGLMIAAPGYVPLFIGVSGTGEEDRTLEVGLERLPDTSAVVDGYDVVGIGAILDETQPQRVIDTVSKSPSAGRLRPGDVISRVDGRPTDGLPLEELRDLLLGFDGDAVKVSVLRRDGSAVDVELVRARYHVLGAQRSRLMKIPDHEETPALGPQ